MTRIQRKIGNDDPESREKTGNTSGKARFGKNDHNDVLLLLACNYTEGKGSSSGACDQVRRRGLGKEIGSFGAKSSHFAKKSFRPREKRCSFKKGRGALKRRERLPDREKKKLKKEHCLEGGEKREG